MKQALIGLSNNIEVNFNKIKSWALSFKKHSKADIVLLCANATDSEINKCKTELNITVVSVIIDNTWFINHKRLGKISDFIKTSDYDLVLVTDVFDVIFQSDPFIKMDLNYDIFVGGEGILISDEPWNSDNINKLFPESYELCKNNEIVCSGVIGGKKDQMISLYDRMYELCENSSNNHNIKDQAALNVMIAKNEVANLKIFNLNDAWAVHCAVAGPTQFFDSWGFKGKLKYHAPYLNDDKILTENKIFDIVHQFNRIPEWNSALTKEYE